MSEHPENRALAVPQGHGVALSGERNTLLAGIDACEDTEARLERELEDEVSDRTFWQKLAFFVSTGGLAMVGVGLKLQVLAAALFGLGVLLPMGIALAIGSQVLGKRARKALSDKMDENAQDRTLLRDTERRLPTEEEEPR